MYRPAIYGSAPDLHLSARQKDAALEGLANDILALQREHGFEKARSYRSSMNSDNASSTLDWLDHQIKLVEHRRIACEQQRQWISDFRLGLESEIGREDGHQKQDNFLDLPLGTPVSPGSQRKKRLLGPEKGTVCIDQI